ncbi:hypothetical protein [Citricoccus sp. GCM10030269]|uniref:hypothetical protein n=1 Tax=Citricoccus sp. GCM10030269 TaxID=3273388 RepID=UPI003620B513
MSPRRRQSTPDVFTIDKARELRLTNYRLYRSGLKIPYSGLRINSAAESIMKEPSAQRSHQPSHLQNHQPDHQQSAQQTAQQTDPTPREYSNAELGRMLALRDPSLVISHQTAAETWGIWLPSRMRTTRLHLSRVRGEGSMPRYLGAVGHFVHKARDTDLRTIDDVRITSPEWTWTELASQGLTVHELVAAGDALLQRADGPPRPMGVLGQNPLSSREILRELVERRRGVPGIRNLRIALELLRERVDSERESRLRTRLVDSGWPEPDVNPRLRFDDGWEALPDLAYRLWRIALQYEGEHHFSQAKQYRSDMNRDEQLRMRDWQTLRVDSSVFTARGWRSFTDRLAKAIEQQTQQLSPMEFRVIE